MPILDMQRRARELGRIRIGQVQPTANGRTRPAKLDRFRITAHSRDLIAKIAGLYGGDVAEWQPQGGGPAGWEVITTSTRLPILVPPQPVTQWYELWSGGGCQRRCDGIREVLKDQACPCGPDPADRTCKPTTRLNVVLREVEGIGVFRLESHGYYAAAELPMAAELLATAGGYISGHLGLEERVIKRDGETRRFMVPTIDIEMTPGQLLAAGSPTAVTGPQRSAIAGEQRAALPAGTTPSQPTGDVKPTMSAEQEQAIVGQIADTTAVQLRSLWTELSEAFFLPAGGVVDRAVRARLAQLNTTRNNTADPPPATAADPDDLWATIVRTVPDTWTSTQLEHEFANYAGVPAEMASATDMAAYLQHLRAS